MDLSARALLMASNAIGASSEIGRVATDAQERLARVTRALAESARTA